MLLLAAPAGASVGLRAQRKPAHLSVPFTPGGSTDILVRALAPSRPRARARPVALSDSSGGNGSTAHICFEYLKLRAGILKLQLLMLQIPWTDPRRRRVCCAHVPHQG